MAHISEYEVETKFIDRLESIGYQYVELENYEDVLFFMKKIIQNKKGLMGNDERNLFSRACKNYISSNRKGNRIIEAYEDKERKKGHSDYQSDLSVWTAKAYLP